MLPLSTIDEENSASVVYTIAYEVAASGAAVADFPALWVFNAEGLIEIIFLTCGLLRMFLCNGVS